MRRFTRAFVATTAAIYLASASADDLDFLFDDEETEEQVAPESQSDPSAEYTAETSEQEEAVASSEDDLLDEPESGIDEPSGEPEEAIADSTVSDDAPAHVQTAV